MQHFSGKDGSREIKTLRIDATGTGKSFQAAPASAITKNGVAVSLIGRISWSPLTLSLLGPFIDWNRATTVVMPAGTTCAGGKTKDLCLMSFTTDAGFGNCVVAQQATAAGATGAAADNSTTVATGAVAGNSTTTTAEAASQGKRRRKVSLLGMTPVLLYVIIFSICNGAHYLPHRAHAQPEHTGTNGVNY